MGFSPTMAIFAEALDAWIDEVVIVAMFFHNVVVWIWKRPKANQVLREALDSDRADTHRVAV